ncbi:MAG: lipid-A-disaccharide synthase [candidate division WOR-3 bacterium]
MRIFISAGEPSGDERGAELVREFLRIKPSLELVGMGGPLMAEAGVRLLADISKGGGVVGVQEALVHMGDLSSLVKRLAREALKSDLMLTIDYPGFHLYLASKVRHPNAIYYIPPQTWAWGGFRLGLLSRYYKKLLCILPFEERYFKDRGLDALFVGHPLVDKLQDTKPTATTGKPVFAFLPGSRPHEVRRLSRKFIRVKDILKARFSGAEFLLSLLPGLEGFWPPDPDFRVLPGMAPEVLAASDAALVASGTASLEAGYLGTPSVVVYMVSELTYWLARGMIKVPHTSLTNIILGREVFPEHIQHIDPEMVAEDMTRAIEGGPQGTGDALFELRGLLGYPGAGKRAAEAILGAMGCLR